MPLGFKNRREPEQSAGESHPMERGALLDQGLFRAWYTEYRAESEYIRADRYGRPLTLLQASPSLIPGEQTSQPVLAAAITAAKKIARDTDLLGWGPDSSIVIIMPETSIEGAESAASRWQTDLYLRTQAARGHKWIVRTIDARACGSADELTAALHAPHRKGAAA